MLKKIISILVLSAAFCSSAYASSPPPRVYTPVSRPHTWQEWGADFAIIYAVQWAGYAASQPTEFAHISFETFEENVFEKGAVLWDGDVWAWNFIAHPWVGSEYYLYFRSRGYAPRWAFVGSLVSSTMFELLVETFSEPFSVNDFVITPLAGSLLGYCREKWALRLLHTDSRFNRFWGHVLWWETCFWFFEDVQIVPGIDPDGDAAGLMFFARF